MNQDIQNLEKEKEELIQKTQSLEQSKNQILIRLAEIQGIIKYLKGKEEPKKEEK